MFCPNRLFRVAWPVLCLGRLPAFLIQATSYICRKHHLPPSSSSFLLNYLTIFITPVLSVVFERMVSVRLGRFMELTGELPTT